MFTFEDERTHFNFSGTYEGYTIAGTCVFTNEKLYEVNATVSVPVENPELEGDLEEIGTFNYSAFLDDRANYSYYISYERVREFSAVLPDIIESIEQSRESLS